MTEEKIAEGHFRHDKDTAAYHRYQLDAENGNIRGTLYIRRDAKKTPDTIVFRRISN
jgi:hypothetical protein